MSANGTTNGNGNGHNGHGNGHSPWKNIGAESFNLGVAEAVSMVVSLGVVAVADQVAPSLLKSCSSAIGSVIEPYLDRIETGLKAVCKLEECQPDLSRPASERAENIAKTVIVFGSAWATSMLFKMATRKVMNDISGLTVKAPRTGHWHKDFYNDFLKPSAHDKQVFYWDEGVHYGALVLLNTGLASYTDEMLHSTSSMLQKFGVSKRKADELATMGVVWELPNMLGFAAGVGAIANHHLSMNGKTHTARLAQQTALASTLHKTL